MSKPIKNIRKRLTVKSTTDNLSEIRNFVKRNAIDVGFSEEIANKIVLASDEACTNIIKHAYKYAKSGKITIYISFAKNKFSISITDQGKQFNSNSIKEPNLKKYYDEKRVGGLGMFLMKKLMDDVKYSKPKPNKNKVILVKYLK